LVSFYFIFSLFPPFPIPHQPFTCIIPGLSITWTPLGFTPCIFLVYFGDMFFSLFIVWGHSVAASC
jgi:hypothetical protein